MLEQGNQEEQSYYKMVEHLHKAFKHPVRKNPTNPDTTNEHRLRLTLILEELNEVLGEMMEKDRFKIVEVIKTNVNMASQLVSMVPDEAFRNLNLEKLAKELSDLLVVVSGTGVVFGIDLDKAFSEVHKSNMSKLDKNGVPVYRDDGKFMKSDLYKEPDMSVIWSKEEEKTSA